MASRPSRDQPSTGGIWPLAVLPNGEDTAGRHITKNRTHVRHVGVSCKHSVDTTVS